MKPMPCLVMACAASMVAAPEPAGQLAAAPIEAFAELPAVPAATRKTVEHDGQTFELATSTTGKNVRTDEYVVAGEQIADWTQLVTVQRLTIGRPTATSEFLAYFRTRVESESGATLDVLREGKAASVFAARFPKSARNDEQVMICLAFADAADPATLDIVQYAIKPTRVPVALVERRIKSWRDKFLRQAQAAAPSP